MATAVVNANSPLQRNGWTMEGLIQTKAKSFWSPYTGSSSKSIVYYSADYSKKEGHEVVFDYTGNLSGEARVDKEQATGHGEDKRKFYDALRVRRLRYPVNNGDKFDGVNIGDLSITEHVDTRDGLADLWVRAKDQALFDASQGYLERAVQLDTDSNINYAGCSHVVLPDGVANRSALTSADILTYDLLLDLEYVAKTGTGATFGGTRSPLKPYMLSNGEPVWLLVIDAKQAANLRKSDSKWVDIAKNADLRGADNAVLRGVIGRLGSLLIVEAPNFHGVSSSRVIGKSSVEISGLRTIDEAGTFSGTKTAQSGIIASRCLLLGQNAMQFGMGKMPEYSFKYSDDFGISSESLLEVWCNAQKVRYKAENEDYESAKVANMDAGMIAVDLYHSTI